MKAVLSDGTSKVGIHEQIRGVTVVHNPNGTIVAEVRITTCDMKAIDWLFDRFKDDKPIYIELQRVGMDNQKFIIKNARIVVLRPFMGAHSIATNADLIADNCVTCKGRIGKPEVTPEKVIFT